MNQKRKMTDNDQEIEDLKEMNKRDEWNQVSSWIFVLTGFGYIVFIIWDLIVFSLNLGQTDELILFIIKMFVFVVSVLNIINWFLFGRKNVKNRINSRNKLIELLEKDGNEVSSG